MRIFNSAVQAVKEVEREVAEMGMRVTTKSFQDKIDPDGFDTREIIGYSFTLTKGNDWEDTFEALGMKDYKECRNYVIREVDSRIAKGRNLNPGLAWHERPHTWKKFLENSGMFSYTYPERIHQFNQIEGVIDLHNYDPNSRQMVIPIYHMGFDHISRGGKRRIPCTMHFQLLDRNDDLYLIHSMRSLDLYTHLAIDLSVSWLMVDYFANLWEKKWPRVVMQVASLHAFQTDIESRQVF